MCSRSANTCEGSRMDDQAVNPTISANLFSTSREHKTVIGESKSGSRKCQI